MKTVKVAVKAAIITWAVNVTQTLGLWSFLTMIARSEALSAESHEAILNTE